MKYRRSALPALALAAVASFHYLPAAAAAIPVVQVQEAEGPSDYSIALGRTDLHAGKVSFEVANASKAIEHEFVVARTDLPAGKLPYDDSTQKVDESKVTVVGEVEDLAPGASGSHTFNLKPGRYVAFCNVPGHYKAGMYTTFTVE